MTSIMTGVFGTVEEADAVLGSPPTVSGTVYRLSFSGRHRLASGLPLLSREVNPLLVTVS